MDPREWLFDQRVVRRNLDKGVLTWKAYQEYLKALADRETGSEPLSLDSRSRAPSPVSDIADADDDDEDEDDSQGSDD